MGILTPCHFVNVTDVSKRLSATIFMVYAIHSSGDCVDLEDNGSKLI
jgi:hypothetical protein